MRYRSHDKRIRALLPPVDSGLGRGVLSFLVFMLVVGFEFSSERVVAQDRRDERLEMVESQLEGRDITNPGVLKAMRSVPRHLFVPEPYREYAYRDRALPIAEGQTISQPYIVALMTQQIEPDSADRVLEVGTGSGYQAAVLAEIVETVKTIEIVESLADSARKRLQSLGYDNVEVKHGDGYEGWEAYAPYDAVVVTAAAEDIPPPLVDQLKNGGLMVIPVAESSLVQRLRIVEKQGSEIRTRDIIPVRFVPLIRDNE